jgi:predicted metal-dependent phosphoesterase TrpH
MLSPEELIRRAVEVGLDGVVITEHDYLWSAREVEEVLAAARQPPLVVLRGQEVSCGDGHLLVYGVDERLEGWGTRAELAAEVRRRGGATVVAHPFRWNGFAGMGLEALGEALAPFDAIESLTCNHSKEEGDRALEVGRRLRLAVTGAGDAHAVDQIGRFATRFTGPIRDERALAAALQGGRFQVELMEDACEDDVLRSFPGALT